MRKIGISLLLVPTLLLAQEHFSFPIYFEDAVGHRDTVYFGYDSTATDSLDAVFGEADISHVPWDTALDVRLTGVWKGASHWQGQYNSPFQTKKLVAGPRCDDRAPVFSVEILTRHWPVTARWDSTLFQGACKSTHAFSSIISDAVGGSRRIVAGETTGLLGLVPFKDASTITFTEQKYGLHTYLYEITPDSARVDTVNLFWIFLNEAAFDRYVLSVPPGDKQPGSFRLSSSGLASFSLSVPGHATVTAFTPSGRKVAVLMSETFAPGSHARRLDVATLPKGLYVLKIRTGGRTESHTFVRTE